MYHLQISWWRRGRSAEVTTDEVPEPSSRGRSDDLRLTKLALSAALAQLTTKQRAVIVLRFFEDQTEAATAEVLGVTVGTVKSQTAKALAKLRSNVAQFEEVIR